MSSKKLLLIGFLVLLLGIILIVCSLPIFAITSGNTSAQQVPKSASIMDYSIEVTSGLWNSAPIDILVEMNANQTLNIGLVANGPFDFSIIVPQSTFNEIYLSKTKINSLSTSWVSPSANTYVLQFTTNWQYGTGGSQTTDINAKVTKSWTETVNNPVTITENRPLIDSNFTYMGLSMILSGGIIALLGISRRQVRLIKKEGNPSAQQQKTN